MNNTYHGIYGDRCGRSVIAHNNVSFNGWHGVFLYGNESGPCVLDSNVILDNGVDGVFIRYSNNNTITGNPTGIGNHNSSPTIMKNIITNNQFGIGNDSSSNPKISDNIINGNKSN